MWGITPFLKSFFKVCNKELLIELIGEQCKALFDVVNQDFEYKYTYYVSVLMDINSCCVGDWACPVTKYYRSSIVAMC